MKTFSTRDAIGMTWAAGGDCHAVRLQKAGSGCRVVSYWSESGGGGADVSSLLARGLAALGEAGNTVIIAGGVQPTAGTADVSVPVMSARDLGNALRYEVIKHAPLAEEDLSWGYRIIGKCETRLDIRLYYLRRTEWESWAGIVSGMRHGVDMLLPPAAATDPVFGDVPMAAAGLPGLAFTPSSEAGSVRELLPFDQGGADVFGALPGPLAAPGVALGDLGALPEADQLGFAGAVILGAYGLGGSIKHDSDTCPELPVGIKLARHRGSRLLAGVLASYLLVVCALTLGVKYVSAASELRDIRATNAALRDQLARLDKEAAPGTVFDGLQDEFQVLAAGLDTSLSGTLTNLTELLDESLWVSMFTWKNGGIEMDVRGADDDTTFLKTLEQSGLFTDIVPLRKVVDPRNAMTLKVQLRPVGGGAEVKP